MLFTIGAVLTLRAALAGDRQAACAVRTRNGMAGVPAGIALPTRSYLPCCEALPLRTTNVAMNDGQRVSAIEFHHAAY